MACAISAAATVAHVQATTATNDAAHTADAAWARRVAEALGKVADTVQSAFDSDGLAHNVTE
jgi:hypothetical protein